MKYILLVLNWESRITVMPPKKAIAGENAAPKAPRTAKAAAAKATRTTAVKAAGAAGKAATALPMDDSEKTSRKTTGGADDDSDDDINDLIKKEDPAADSDTETVASTATIESEQYYDETLPMIEPAVENLRREIVIVPDNERRTSFLMDLYTAAALITIRAGQITETGRAFVETTGLQTADEVARKELLDGRCPLIVRRKVGQKIVGDVVYVYYEHFRPAEMIFPQELQSQ